MGRLVATGFVFSLLFAVVADAQVLSTTPAWTGEADQAMAHFGWAAASAGDVNGDGYDDLIVAAYLYDNGQTDEGRALVYLGSASGLQAAPAWTAEGNQTSAFFGFSAASAGDVNGDGYDDVIVGASQYDNGQTNEGAVFVYLGSASGLSPTPAWTAESDQASAQLGRAVASAGDVDGDGYDDVIVGAPLYANGEATEGKAFLYRGSASGLSSTPSWTAEGDLANALFGSAVASAGDVNGDGFDDLIVGAYQYTNGQNIEGRAFLYLGSASGLSPTPAWTAESDQASASFGYALSSAGDVNGDGYADVAIGCYGFDNGQIDEGRVFVYLGSASGLGAAPAWTAESNQPMADFGHAVASAGDVDGDGYDDLVVGALRYDNGQIDEGLAFVYLGSASGLTSVPAWVTESNRANAQFGGAVGSAGDVNGDGYGDVVIGAGFYTNGQSEEGRAFAYLGGSAVAAGRVDGLTLGKAPSEELTLTWGASCSPTDVEYEVYEGALGSFSSHVPLLCGTGGATTATIVPRSGDAYYLVVPRNGAREGSYGTDGAGAERPAGASECLPPQIGGCP